MTIYEQNGFTNRTEYLQTLKEEYGADLVDALTSVLPASEDFDGLISELEDNFAGFAGDYSNGFDLFG